MVPAKGLREGGRKNQYRLLDFYKIWYPGNLIGRANRDRHASLLPFGQIRAGAGMGLTGSVCELNLNGAGALNLESVMILSP
jgi:hypothetical protein